jgi:flagellar biogenesis protein FliO
VDLTRQSFIITGVVALLWLLLWLLRKKGIARFGSPRGNGRARSLETLERLALTPNHTVHLIRAGNRTFLVGAHPSGMVVFSNESHAAESFAEALAREAAAK